jgi:hypothetical protein
MTAQGRDSTARVDPAGRSRQNHFAAPPHAGFEPFAVISRYLNRCCINPFVD